MLCCCIGHLVRLLTLGADVPLAVFCLCLRLFSSLFSLNMRAFSFACLILLCPVFLSSLGGLLFSKEEMGGTVSGEEVGGARKSEWNGKVSVFGMYSMGKESVFN